MGEFFSIPARNQSKSGYQIKLVRAQEVNRESIAFVNQVVGEVALLYLDGDPRLARNDGSGRNGDRDLGIIFALLCAGNRCHWRPKMGHHGGDSAVIHECDSSA